MCTDDFRFDFIFVVTAALIPAALRYLVLAPLGRQNALTAVMLAQLTSTRTTREFHFSSIELILSRRFIRTHSRYVQEVHPIRASEVIDIPYRLVSVIST